MHSVVRLGLVGWSLSVICLCAHGDKVGGELQTQAEAALGRGAAYLLTLQNPDGSFGKYPHPAIAALAVMGLHQTPGVADPQLQPAIDRAMAYVISFAQPDGSIYPAGGDLRESGNYPNYSTSIALLAMATLNRPQDLELMKRARRFLQASQFGDPDSVDYGGVGYGKTQRADLSNVSWSAEALYYTDYLDREPQSADPEAAKRTEEMWQKLSVFLTKCQNLPETNDQPYVSKKPEDRGGFFYRPFESKAGTHEGDGTGAAAGLVSSGSMTYAGLKSMLYARLQRQDARVKGAMDYLMRNWTLAENPGMGQQGLYYYLLTMAKALDAYDREVLVDQAGQRHQWRQEVARRYVELQQESGAWSNPNGRYMEALPELTTSYCLMGLKVTLGLTAPAHP